MSTPVQSPMPPPGDAAEPTGLPENAFRELAPGERFQPMVPASKSPPEVTVRSVVQGVLWSIVFSAAATYIILKLGQGIESAIPISILAVGASALLARTLGRASTLLENVNVLALGATSGIVAGGSVFTMPAIFILGLEGRSSFWQIFLVPLLGAVLGVFLLAPFRRYFTRDLHGKLPFPEGRATTEILVAGNKGGDSAITLAWSAGLAALFDFIPNTKAWSDTFSTAAISALHGFTGRVKAVFTMNTSAAIFGLGYIMGVDYAAIILAGSFISYFVLIPIFAWVGPHLATPLLADTKPLADMAFNEIFKAYAQPIGIGGIFAAGLLSILKMSPVIGQAVKVAVTEVVRLVRGQASVATSERTDRGIPMAGVLGGMALTTVVTFLYFRFSVVADVPGATRVALLSAGLTLGIAFLFAAVSAWAIAMISITPISGMTLTTLIITAVLLKAMGLGGQDGMLQTLLIGGVVCTALSMSGSLVSQYKIGYWLGATPRRIEWGNIVGSVIASLATTATIFLMAHVYGFTQSAAHPQPMQAPQPNAMAAVLTGVMGTGNAPWFLYGLGAVFAISAELCGVSGLALALGMYLPMDLNSPLILGAGVAWLLKRSSKDEKVAAARHERGTLVASGFIAGGALIGVGVALLKFFEDKVGHALIPDLSAVPGLGPVLDAWSNWSGLGAFLLLGAVVYVVSRRSAKEPVA